MQDIQPKIRWNIDFILSELGKIPGSDEVKNEVRAVCEEVNNVLAKPNSELLETELKAAISGFDTIIDKINGVTENQMIFMLLITHIADMKFLFLSEEQQKELTEEMNNSKNAE